MTELDHEDTPGLTTKQKNFITALLSSSSIVEAARLSGVAEITAHRWLKLDAVRQAYQDAQREVFDSSLTSLKLASIDAVTTLTQLMKDSETPASTRVRAAQIVLEQAIELHKVAELEARLAELEQRLQQQTLR